MPLPPKIVFLGDSIPDGYGLENYSADDNTLCDSYPNILRERFGNELSGICDFEAVNRAVSGDTSSQLLGHIQSGELDDALKDSDAVVVSIGGNDILEIFLDTLMNTFDKDDLKNGDINLFTAATAIQKMSKEMDTALDGFEVNLSDIMSQLKSRTDGKIFLQTLYNPFEDFDYIPLIPSLAKEKIGRLNGIIGDYSETDGYEVADVASSFEGKAEEITNIDKFDIHPNAQGHEIIADVVEDALRTETYSYTVYEEVPEASGSMTYVGFIVIGVTVAIVIVRVVLKHRRLSGEGVKV